MVTIYPRYTWHNSKTSPVIGYVIMSLSCVKGDGSIKTSYDFFSCVDCSREFQTREELEDHKSTH